VRGRQFVCLLNFCLCGAVSAMRGYASAYDVCKHPFVMRDVHS
jgi:hypothetical protein